MGAGVACGGSPINDLVKSILNLANEIRYAAVYTDGTLHSQERTDLSLSSSTESDKYEKWLVNPAILKLATQRGNIDCGGTEYVLIRYGNFFQFIMSLPNGHVSVSIESDSDILQISRKIQKHVANRNS
ncbi:hypothetical protein MJD09_25265 [bacterium]|nr:hypothetical protein [bacterium]